MVKVECLFAWLSQRSPAKQVAWIFGHRPEKTKKDGSTFCVELATGCKAPGFYGQNKFRRLPIRYAYHAENFLGVIQLGCVIFLLRLS
jgi:hypothetical protein